MIDSKIKEFKDTFLSLVRLGIGHKPISLPKNIDWKRIYKISQKHGVAAITLDGAEKMFADGINPECPDMHPDFKLYWISVVYDAYERAYLKYTESLGRLAKFYNSRGFKLMILKGYGLSLDYPTPNHRPCGDIDTWSFGDYKAVDAAIEEEFDIQIDSSHHHHTVYKWGEFSVENHYDFVNVHYGHNNDKLELIYKELAKDDSHYTEIDGNRIYLPSPNLNALFLLRHAMLHFASTKINIRQLLDWAFFMKRYGSQVDWNWLLGVLKDFNMIKFFDYINAICVCDLGFDSADYPYISNELEFKERILNDIIFPEFRKPEPKGKIALIFFKLRRRHSNAWKREICYGDEGAKAFIVSVMSHLIKPKG